MNLLLRKIRHRPTRPAFFLSTAVPPPRVTGDIRTFRYPAKFLLTSWFPEDGSRKKRCNCDYRWFARKMIRAVAKDLLLRKLFRGRSEASNRTACRGFYSLYVVRWYVIISDTKSDNGNIAFEKIGVFHDVTGVLISRVIVAVSYLKNSMDFAECSNISPEYISLGAQFLCRRK